MKKLLLLITMVTLGSGVWAQSYYYIYHPPGSGNPAGLNTENDVLNDVSQGWINLIGDGSGFNGYSETQSFPFFFTFNGTDVVNEYKVSSTGYVTFDLAASGTPETYSEALPSANLPDKTISIWGMELAIQDQVLFKTFGYAPYRQHWIKFYSMSTPGFGGNIYSYWAIVLEETTNKIYIVEMLNGSINAPYTSPEHSIGIQIDGSNATQVNGSPNITRQGNISYLAEDNGYYEFIYGIQKEYDLGIKNIDISEIATKGKDEEIKVRVKNYGSKDITNFKISYSIDGIVTTQTVNDTVKPNGGELLYTFNKKWTPQRAGKYNKLKFWLSDVEGGMDENSDNDRYNEFVLVNYGITVTKNALIDEVSATWCGHCPDEIPYLNQIRDAYGDRAVIVYHHHASGGLQGFFANPQSLNLMGTYLDEYPQTMVDRAYQSDRGRVAFSRTDDMDGRVNKQLDKTSPVNVSIIDKNWNPDTRIITFTVKAEFVDYTVGDMRIGAYVVEDKVRGVGPGFDQIIYNTYTGNPDHMFYKYKNPMVGYIYPNVVRGIPSGPFGTEGSIPDYLKPLGKVYTYTYTFELPPEVEVDIPETSDFPPYGKQIGYNKIADVSLVGFVIMDNPDKNKREIVNVTSEPMFNVANSVADYENKSNISVYPNPASGVVWLDYKLLNSSNLSISIINSVGKTVKLVANRQYNAGEVKETINVSDLTPGVYFIKVQSNQNAMELKKFIVM